MAYVAAFIRFLLLAVFLVAAVSKLRDGRRFREFSSSVAALPVVPARLVGPVSLAVVGAEVVASGLLMAVPSPALTAAGLGLATVLLTGFTVAITVVLRRGLTASCRCFGGSASAPFGWHHVARNAVLGLLGLVGVYAVLRGPDPGVDTLALMAPFALITALLTIRLDDLVQLFTPISVTDGRR
ncbi:MauE/DoxX family redox-associated membrane protein [Micromonospora robiginosa]|uniref:MauE/DoxX family redox-associated membrane protein n=1 Tax=Micromonospora robiginosa TaxID=2749844 RepID=A0A7L6B915_9ACTN|nr:MauE/DoxX family redox-associated membrane protein [Micromonospora ferruginea]QLQ38040.1 MauE/DoxX family redox-associated membrane protein [Micromonospora ferruginea]